MRSPADDASRFRYFRRISYPYFGDSALNYLHARGHRDEQSAGQYVLVLFEPSCYAPRPLFLEAERPMTDQTTRGIAAATSGGRRPRQRRTRPRPAARPVIGPEKQKTHIQPHAPGEAANESQFGRSSRASRLPALARSRHSSGGGTFAQGELPSSVTPAEAGVSGGKGARKSREIPAFARKAEKRPRPGAPSHAQRKLGPPPNILDLRIAASGAIWRPWHPCLIPKRAGA